MTDLPKMTFREFQELQDTLAEAAAKAAPAKHETVHDDPFAAGDPPPPQQPKPEVEDYGFKRLPDKRDHHAKPEWSKPCGCTCSGCTNPHSGSQHCLKGFCTRKRNRRSPAEIADADRLANGKPRRPGSQPYQGVPPKHRTKDELATADRYPNGRLKPDRSNWAKKKTRTKPKPPPPLTLDNVAKTPIMFWVHATRRNTTVRLPAPRGMGEAFAMAGHLLRHGWSGGASEIPWVEGNS